MNTSSQLPKGSMNQILSEQKNALGALLELLPYAALLIHVNSQRIQAANPRISELTLFTRTELIGMPASHLFLNWDQEFIQKLNKSPNTDRKSGTLRWQISDNLTRRNETSTPVRLTFGPISNIMESVLVLIEPTATGQAVLGRRQADQFWEGMATLVNALQENEFSTALEQVLQSGKSITGAELLAVYQAHGRNPILKQRASVGPAHLLPEHLSAQDLIRLKKPMKWVFGRGKRPTGSLHRAARSARFSYMCSVPLGQLNAMIGLIVIGDTSSNPPAEHILEMAQFLGDTITSLLQKHTWMAKAKKDLSVQSTQLRISETLEEQSSEGILILDPTFQIQSLNAAAEMILGYANREVANHPVDKVLIGTESLLPALSAAQEGSATYSMGNLHLYRRNGEAFLALVRIFPVMNGDKVEKILLLIRDLSEQEQIRIQAQQLEQRALLGEVTAIFAHEVRNPINNISTGLQLMAMSMPKEDPNRESIDRMMLDCDRLTELVKSVLAYSRPTDYDMEMLDLGILIRRLLDRLHPRITRLNVIPDLKVEPECPKILGNARALEQVFNNLITNSLQAMDKNGGSLVIKVQPVDTLEGQACVEVSIADTGPGIADEIKHRIFQPFFTTKEHGTGLGLAISKRIVTAHKGTIDLESFPGGSIFIIHFPIAKSKA